jgi:large subunit ribosomal protein L4
MSERTATVNVVSPSGSTDTTVDLPAEIFGAKVNVPLMHQVVVAQQAAARQGTHSARNRGAVRGGGRKPYRQKGTGRARQGSIRAPQFAGGGTVHGPVPRSYEQRTPKKMKAAALRGALSDRAAHGRVHVVSSFTEGDAPRTRDALSVLLAATGTTPASAPVLVVTQADDTVTWKSLRNVPGVHLLDAGQLNTYDVLVSDHVVFTEAALGQFLARSGFPGAAPPEVRDTAVPEAATPETAEAATPEAPEAAAPETPEAAAPETPEAAAPETPEAATPPETEDAES